MKRVALIFRGGISRGGGRLLDPSKFEINASDYINFKACANSIKQNLIHANPNYHFDIFFHSWEPAIAEQLDDTWRPLASCHESNRIFWPEISFLTRESMLNYLMKALAAKDLDFFNFRRTKRETFAGISQALAISRALDLFERTVNTNDYKLVVLYRADVMLLCPINLDDFNEEFVYVNRYGDREGDFRWVLSPQSVSHFSGLVSSIRVSKNYHQQHKWIRDWFDFSQTTSRKTPYISDNILAGRDEEVVRKLKTSGIPYSSVEKFGLTLTEYERYSN
jgi:hypothetical protein